ncbi:hypothetical protein CTA1_12424 [Colletotrichum tanaceti]|uniref:Uncharacterized protein n=1 Tax=Colletotrichum tanaceti TaxID=1306861 RepID=A0A4V6DGF2_9PEZI|nr:hypothetical protein CTA1_12424 [Colletotrichum tanaceti]
MEPDSWRNKRSFLQQPSSSHSLMLPYPVSVSMPTTLLVMPRQRSTILCRTSCSRPHFSPGALPIQIRRLPAIRSSGVLKHSVDDRLANSSSMSLKSAVQARSDMLAVVLGRAIFSASRRPSFGAAAVALARSRCAMAMAHLSAICISGDCADVDESKMAPIWPIEPCSQVGCCCTFCIVAAMLAPRFSSTSTARATRARACAPDPMGAVLSAVSKHVDTTLGASPSSLPASRLVTKACWIVWLDHQAATASRGERTAWSSTTESIPSLCSVPRQVVGPLDNGIVENVVALELDQGRQVLGEIVVNLLRAAAELGEHAIQGSGLVPQRTGELLGDNVVEALGAEVPEEHTNVQSLEHEPPWGVGKGAGCQEREREAALVDLDVASRQLRVQSDRPGLDTRGLLLLRQAGEHLVAVDANGVAHAQLHRLQYQGRGLEEEVVLRDPDGLDGRQPGLTTHVNRRCDGAGGLERLPQMLRLLGLLLGRHKERRHKDP